MIRYFRPDSSDCSRFMCVAHSTYSGIESSSKPMKSTTRSLAATSTTMPRIEVSSSAKYSPSPASTVATERHDSSTAAIPPATKIITSVSVRLSTTIAEAMIASLTSHCQTPSPAVTANVTIVSTGTTVPRMKPGARQPDQQHHAGARRSAR